VRRQVCKRIDRRLREFGLPDIDAYTVYLESHPDEWMSLDELCRISISRFYRDKRFFEELGRNALPKLIQLALRRGDSELRCWSVGCASGEEPYSLNILWKLESQCEFPLKITATDVDNHLLERARRAHYSKSSLKDIPPKWHQAFEETGGNFVLREEFRQGIEFSLQDVRQEIPEESFHLILCRNLVFTYFDEVLQREVLARIKSRLIPDGVLLIGHREKLP
jgi:chemotaxis protein methyltransferase CheR